jgi:hypothetical protein
MGPGNSPRPTDGTSDERAKEEPGLKDKMESRDIGRSPSLGRFLKQRVGR